MQDRQHLSPYLLVHVAMNLAQKLDSNLSAFVSFHHGEDIKRENSKQPRVEGVFTRASLSLLGRFVGGKTWIQKWGSCGWDFSNVKFAASEQGKGTKGFPCV